MDQRDFFNKCASLAEQGFTITNLNLATGEVVIVLPVEPVKPYPENALTAEEIRACQKSKIEGIKVVRNLRNMSLKEAKDFVEEHYDFPPPMKPWCVEE